MFALDPRGQTCDEEIATGIGDQTNGEKLAPGSEAQVDDDKPVSDAGDQTRDVW